MATKKNNSKKITKKARQITRADVIKSVAITSVLLNLMFLITIFVLTSTSTFDRRFYTAARKNYCKNVQALKDRVEELGDETEAQKERQVDCIGKDFKPFYQEALDKYNAQPAQ